MNLWRKILYWDHKIDHAVKNKLMHILVLVFSISVVFGIILSTTYRSYQVRAINSIEKDLIKLETDRMNKLLDKAVESKFN